MTLVRSWAEEVRVAEVDRAIRQLQGLGVKDKAVLESLSRSLVSELLAPTTSFARQTSKAFPNSRRLPIVCGMFGRRGVACSGSHCSAITYLPPNQPPEELCAMAGVASNRRWDRAL